ncbi:hypothetical protein AWB82_05601 [Caballeronia glebae]|jgi:hypothetical protein|uniref:DUF2934 domain-containing protein n=1 Tax=Caballeronia glebae TaxID=1777143 RepID=A0A158CMM3_9BURK|nr:hypothetical protein AWB82_05601 [Caballeronia glebae]
MRTAIASGVKSRNWEGIVDDQKEQDRIRRRAYEIWEREGSPEGRAEEFWQQALASIEAEDSPGSAGGQTVNGDADVPRNQSGREAESPSGATAK